MTHASAVGRKEKEGGGEEAIDGKRDSRLSPQPWGADNLIGPSHPITLGVDINKAPKAHWPPGPVVTPMERIATLGEQAQSLQQDKGSPRLKPDEGDSKYLQVPIDECLHLSSPPCSPVPPNWGELLESPPVPWIEDFDLEAESGLVHLGNGQWIDLSAQPGLGELTIENASEGDNGKRTFMVRRRGAILSRRAVSARLGSVKRLCFDDENDASALASTVDTILPPIVVDAYE